MQPSPSSQKKRNRRTTACAQCKSKKVKCDYGDASRCARCIKLSIPCSGRQGPIHQGGSETSRRVEALERKLHKMESLLVQTGFKRSDTTNSGPALTMASQGREVQDAELRDGIRRLSSLSLDDFRPGQSSEIDFLKQVLDIRKSTKRHGSHPSPIPYEDVFPAVFDKQDVEVAPKQYTFPEPGLLRELLNLYFEYINVHFWLFHRASFEENVSKGLHLKDRGFAEVVLLVAATGSRLSTDPRVLAHDAGGNRHSSGWKWFSQVQVLPKAISGALSLYDLQKICVASTYLADTQSHAAWSLAGIGIRIAQGMGLHHARHRGKARTIEDELWKRAFWTLVCIDRMSGSLYGRPCFTHEEQFDIEPPVLADEEYWEHADPRQSFQQPEGKPSKQVCFTLAIRLSEILAFTLRTIYAVGKFKAFLAKSNPRWREDMLEKIGSALDGWHSVVPNYLRWPANPDEPTFFNQSQGLHLAYYNIQIQAHWPFIPSLMGRSSLSLSSLVICANAARFSCHIFDRLSRTSSSVLLPFYAPKAMSSAVILLLYIWEAKKFGLVVDCVQELENIRNCLNFLKLLRSQFVMAMEWSNVSVLEQLLLEEELSIYGVPDPSLRQPAIHSDALADIQPNSTASHQAPDCDSPSLFATHTATQNQPQLLDDFDFMFRAFVSDSLTEDSFVDDQHPNDTDAAPGAGNMYTKIFETFNAAVPPEFSLKF